MTAATGDSGDQTPRVDGRELSRRRSTRRRYPDTGRRHHLGAAPPRMPVYGPDGSIVATTRTSAHQLASLTVLQLDRLGDTLRTEMAGAAAALDFELAAGVRDELAAVTAERARRAG